MWLMIGTIAFLVLLVVAVKVLERRASKDRLGTEDMPPVDMRRLGRNDPYGGDFGDGGGGGGW